jgi:signal transduction histidine kinase
VWCADPGDPWLGPPGEVSSATFGDLSKLAGLLEPTVVNGLPDLPRESHDGREFIQKAGDRERILIPLASARHLIGLLVLNGPVGAEDIWRREFPFLLKLAADVFVNAIERKGAEEQLQRRQAELVHLARVSTMGEMAAGLAHEVNQPLGAIVNYAGGCLEKLASATDAVD